MMAKSKSNDFVRTDGVTKELVANEEKARKRYETRWKFINNLDEYCVDVARERGIAEEEYRRMLIKHKGSGRVVITDVTSSSNSSSSTTPTTTTTGSAWRPTIVPSRPVPRTTAGEIGWRSGLKYELETFGREYVSPKLTINPPDMPDGPVYNIHLG